MIEKETLPGDSERKPPNVAIPTLPSKKTFSSRLLSIQGKSVPAYLNQNPSCGLCISVHHLWVVVTKCSSGAHGEAFLEGECHSSCGGSPTVGNVCTELGSPHSSLCFSCKKGHGISLRELCIVASQFLAVFISSGFIFPH